MSVRSVAAFIFALLLAGSASLRATLAQSEFVGNIKITIAVSGETVPHFGFIPVRVIVENRQARDLHWEATFQSDTYWTGSPNVASWTTNLTLPASRTTERWVYVPCMEAGMQNRGGYYGGSGNLSATFSGTGIRATTLRLGIRGRGAMNQMVPWAVSPTLEPAVRAQIALFQARQPVPSSRPGFPSRPPVMATLAQDLATIDVGQTLGDWRVWAPYARVVMSDADYSAMPPPNRAALHNWVALGGELYLSPSTGGGRSDQRRFGAGSIHHLETTLTEHNPGDGGLFERPALLEANRAVPSANELSLQKSGLSQKMPPPKRVGDWMVYFFIGFALLVGPLNLFVFAPVKRRQRLFFTLPAISIAAVALLVAAIWLQDGVGGDGARRALVVLLPGDNQAAVFQEQVSRSGLLFGASFPLPEDVVCASVPTDDYGPGGRTFTFERQENTASGDWFRSRARQAQHLRRLVPTRARVEQVGTAPDGAPIVQSSVGTTLRNFRLVDASGAWEAREVPSGARVTLSRSTSQEEPGKRASQFGLACSAHFRYLVHGCLTEEPGRFVASTGDFELAPIATLPGIRWTASDVMITGLLDNAGNRSHSP